MALDHPIRVAVVVLNWNGWKDTVACLESLLPSLNRNAQVIVCDNASSDDSLARLQDWASGHVKGGFVQYGRSESQRGGSVDDPQLVMIQTGANLGFAGGNNVGIRYALARQHEYVWLLNNDTVVNERSLPALIERMQGDCSIGLCGSTLVYFDQPDVVQALGGAAYDLRRGTATHIGLGIGMDELPSLESVEAVMSYVIGASMLVSRAFLEAVGLMCEDYFLYFEEADWIGRANGRFRLGWAPDSIVLHKEGASIGSSHRSRPSALSLRYLYENRFRFTGRFHSTARWAVWRHACFEALVYLKRRDFEAASIVFRTLAGAVAGAYR